MNAWATRPARPAFFRLALALGALLGAFYASAALMFVRHGGRAKDFGWTVVRKGGARHVDAVDPRGPAAGRLVPGDRILAVNGDTRIETVFSLHFFLVRPGTAYALRVARGPEEVEVSLPVGLRKESHEVWRALSLLPVSLSFVAAGLFVGFSRPEQRAARLFCLAAAAAGLAALAGALPSLDLLERSEYALAIPMTAASPLHLALAFHFVTAFPPGLPRGRILSFLRLFLSAVAIALSLGTLLQRFLYLRSAERVIAFAAENPALWEARAWVIRLFTPAAIAAILAVMVLNLLVAREPDSRHRAHRALFALAGAVPALALSALEIAARRAGHAGLVAGEGFALAVRLATLCLALVPVALARVLLAPPHGGRQAATSQMRSRPVEP